MASYPCDYFCSLAVLDSTAHCSSSRSPVLVVDDDSVVSSIVCEILSAYGIPVLPAASGQQALEVYKKNGGQIPIVLMEYGLRQMHPSHLLYKLRNVNPAVKVIVSSGYSKREVFSELDVGSVDMFLPKPFAPMALINAVEALQSINIHRG